MVKFIATSRVYRSTERLFSRRTTLENLSFCIDSNILTFYSLLLKNCSNKKKILKLKTDITASRGRQRDANIFRVLPAASEDAAPSISTFCFLFTVAYDPLISEGNYQAPNNIYCSFQCSLTFRNLESHI